MRAWTFIALQHLLPQHAVSRLVHRAARSRVRPFKNALTRAFVAGFRPDMSDAVEPDPLAYESFNAFFTRALRPGARPIAPGESVIVSPVDGTVSECGAIEGNRLLQAKGRHYTLEALLGGDQERARQYVGGTFATIYLAPYNYHRIHMPTDGTLTATRFVPGALFSVNRTTADMVAGLFARNERVICHFERRGLPFTHILVGALNVGSMETVWHGEITPGGGRRAKDVAPRPPCAPLDLPKGAEMARFNMGSTVILLFPRGAASWRAGFEAGAVVRMGQAIGDLHDDVRAARRD